MARQSEDNFRNFFMDNADFLFILDMEGNIIETNHAVSSILGYTNEDLSGKSVLNVHPPEFREIAGKTVARMLSGEEDSCPVPLLTKNNDYIPVETRVFYGTWNSKKALIGVSRNLSELKLSQEKFSYVFENSPVMMSLTSSDENTFIDVNKQFVRTLGYTKEETIGKKLDDFDLFINEKEKQRVFEIFAKEDHVVNVESIIKTKDGKAIYCLFSLDKVRIQTHEYFLISAIDITTQKETEALLHESLNTKNKLFSIISHDLRGPISSFVPVIELLTNSQELNESERTEILKELKSSSKTILNLLENLLNWARSQSGSFILKPTSFIINDLISDNIKLHLSISNQKRISVTSVSDKELAVFADKDSINLVIRNLLSNALKFTQNGGEIRIAVAENGSEIELKFEDNGVGIDKKVLSSLFESGSFYSTQGTNNEKGSGIGLIMCKDFIERNGGSLRVESTQGKGSRFIFTLPSAKQ